VAQITVILAADAVWAIAAASQTSSSPLRKKDEEDEG
jgi:hypothetical protein